MTGFELTIPLLLKYYTHFSHFFIPEKHVIYLKKPERGSEKRLMRRRNWLLFKEKLKRPLVCIKDHQMMELTKKVKSVCVFFISNIKRTWRHPMKI